MGSLHAQGPAMLRAVWRRARATAVVLAALAATAATQPAPSLTNEDVIKMVRADVGARIIITTIQSSGGAFDVSPNGLIALKQAGVSDEIIEAIQAKMAAGRSASGADSRPAAAPEKSDVLADAKDPAVVLRQFKTMFVDASGATYFGNAQMKAALGKNKGFAPLKITIVEDRLLADVVLKVNYTFAWDYPFTLTHQNTSMVLLTGKGSGPFSGPKGASSVASELVKALRPYRLTRAGT